MFCFIAIIVDTVPSVHFFVTPANDPSVRTSASDYESFRTKLT